MKQIFYKYIIIILGFYTLWLGGLPFIFSKVFPVVCENISYNSDYTVEVNKPLLLMNILPTATLKAEDIKIYSKKTNDTFYIKNPKIKLRIFPLFSRTIHINNITVNELKINSVLNNNLELNDKIINQIKNTGIKCDALKLNSFEIVLHEPMEKYPVIYSGKNIYYKQNSRFLKLNTESSININNKSSSADIKLYLPKNNDIKKSIVDIKISEFDLAPLCDFLKNYLPKDLQSISGIVDIAVNKNQLYGKLKHCAINMNEEAKSIIFPELLTMTSDFKISQKTICLKNAELNSQNINLNFSGNITNYLNKSLTELDLNLRINKLRTEDFIKMLPPFKTEDIDAYKLKKYKFYGNAIGNLNIKGDIKEPSINGSVYISNGILTKPIPNTKGATIKLDFRGKYLNYDVIVPASISEKVYVKGGVELYNVKYADFRVWSTKNIDLALAEEKVVPIHEILNFIIGPVPIMDIKGRGNIDITIKGNRKNPHVWGSLNFYDVTTYFLEIPNLVLRNAEAILTFDDENAVFKLLKGNVNGVNIDINGTCNLSGKFDFYAISQKQEIDYLYNAIKTSTMINEVKSMIPIIDDIKGLTDFNLRIFGNVKDISDLKFNENFFIKGILFLKENDIKYNGIKVSHINGKIEYENTNANIDITALINKAVLNAKAIVKNNFADANISITGLNLKDTVNSDTNSNFAGIYTDITGKYKGRTDKIEYDKLDFNAHILGTEPTNKLKISEGSITAKNGNIQIKNVNGNFAETDSSFNINLDINRFAQKPNFNGKIILKDYKLSLINYFSDYVFIPEKIRDILKTIKFGDGKINLTANINNNNVNASTNIGGMTLTYVPYELPIKIINGSLYVRKNYLGLNKINLIAGEMPILVDGGINNIFTKQDFNIYINSKPKQDFIDKYINNNRIYPIKLKGDIVYWIKLKGVKDNYTVESEANLAKDANIYYLGATVGDIENAIVLNLNMDVIKQNFIKIREFSYDKIIESLGKRQTRLNMLKASGGIDIYKDDLGFHDLRIKTSNPTDARIFNIIFRKPNIKEGQFTSDLKFNNKLSDPKLIGTFHIFETDIPFLDTAMKNISFVFKDKTIELSSSGEVLGNDIKFKGTLKNKLTMPYYIEHAELSTKIIDLNYIIDKMKMSQVEPTVSMETITPIDLSNLVIKHLKLKANGFKIRNLTAENIEAILTMSDKKVFALNNFKSDIASGKLIGDYEYNTQNSKTTVKLKAENINANDITYAIFDLNNQIYGDLTGNINVSCIGSDFNRCMQTLSGNTDFEVINGRMPKLGSLEYLLKAGNLIKGGITGLSINSITDIITPLKTGNFSEIYGKMDIKDGIAENIEITTQGKDLSLFISGIYNFSTSIAEMEVLGLLSKKISTMFGPIGNVSLNTLFSVIPGVDLTKDSEILNRINKIPGIELSEKAFRKFIANIKGNINGDDYVTSFSWIN